VQQQKSWQLRLQEIQQLTLRLNTLELRVAGTDQAGAEFMRWEIVKRTSDTSDYPFEN
jgi:hypothetical protein